MGSVHRRRLLMFRTAAVLTVLLLLVSGGASSSRRRSRGRQLSRSHFYFSMDLYQELSGSSPPASNILFSPLNAYTLLSELFLGTLASSNSSYQLRRSLHLSGMSYVSIHSSFREMLSAFRAQLPHSSVLSANGLFLRENVSLNPLYEKGLSQYYQTTIIRFRGDPHAAVEEWAGSAGLLFPLPGAGAGDFLSGHILSVNSDWEIPFSSVDTHSGLFFLPGGERISIPMMSTNGSFPHGHSKKLACRVLEIPFRNRRISMFILLPDNLETGLEDLERDLTKDNMQLIVSKLKTNPLQVRLPRFKIASSIQLERPLQNLGIVDIFSKEASKLNLIAPGHDLYISSILHKSSFVAKESKDAKRDEVPAINGSSSSSDSRPHFDVDHPFVFLVWDYYSGMLLLMGRVNRPNVL